MVKCNVEQVRSTLARGVALITQVRPDQKDEKIDAFNVLRHGVMQASGCEESIREDLLNLDPKICVLDFLINYHEEKRNYRRQVASVLAVLLRSASWFSALHNDENLCSRLPVELRLADKQIANVSIHVQSLDNLQQSSEPSPLHSQHLSPSPRQHPSHQSYRMSQLPLQHGLPLDSPSPKECRLQNSQQASQHIRSEHIESIATCNIGTDLHNFAEDEVAKTEYSPARRLQLPQRPLHPPPPQLSPLKSPVPLHGMLDVGKRVPSVTTIAQKHSEETPINSNVIASAECSNLSQRPIMLNVSSGDQVGALNRRRAKPCVPELRLDEISGHGADTNGLTESEQYEPQFTPQHTMQLSPQDSKPYMQHELQFTPPHTPKQREEAIVPLTSASGDIATEARKKRPSMVVRLWEMVRRRPSFAPLAHNDNENIAGHVEMPDITVTDSDVRAAVQRAKGTAVVHSHQPLRENPEVELENAMALIQKYKHSKEFDDQIAAFQAFHQAVSRIKMPNDSKDTSANNRIQSIKSKEIVLHFLVEVHRHRKVQRKRVCSTLKHLLHFESWQHALTLDEDFCASLPPDLQLIAQSHNLMPVPISVEDTLKNSIKLLEKISYRAAQQTCAGIAFDSFQGGVLYIVESLPDSYATVLGLLEPKAKILEFIVDFHDLDTQNRHATRALLGRLLSLPTWKLVSDADTRLQAKVSSMMADLTPRRDAEVAERCLSPVVAERCCSPKKKKRLGQDVTRTNSSGTKSDDSWYSRVIAFLSVAR